jgi:hypothetical protein
MPEGKNVNGTGEPKAIDLTNNFTTMIEVGTLVAVVCAGIWALPRMVAPRRLSGATLSAKLKWEGAAAEVEQVIASAEQAQASLLAETTAPSPRQEDE